MNSYVTGAMIKRLRERKGLTQQGLADILCVSDKAISKWETGRGYPDISLVEPLAGALGVSVIELFSGEDVRNTNRAFDMRKVCFCVCPVCGNVIQSAGEALISCCGIVLPPLEAEPEDDDHRLTVERVEDEYYVTLDHPMSKGHFISFLAAVSDGRVQLAKLYPEGPAEARFKVDCVERLYACCNRHGLFMKSVK